MVDAIKVFIGKHDFRAFVTENVDKTISLEVKIDNYPAIKLYKKFDFVPKATRKGYYNGIDGILMVRDVK